MISRNTPGKRRPERSTLSNARAPRSRRRREVTAEAPGVRRKDARGPLRGATREPCGHPPSACGRGSRAVARGGPWRAGTCVSCRMAFFSIEPGVSLVARAVSACVTRRKSLSLERVMTLFVNGWPDRAQERWRARAITSSATGVAERRPLLHIHNVLRAVDNPARDGYNCPP